MDYIWRDTPTWQVQAGKVQIPPGLETRNYLLAFKTISRHGGICDVPSTCMLTTSSIPKAVQVCSSKAFAAVQAMTAMTRKIASERIAIGTNLVVKTLELNLSLKQAKKWNIQKRSEIKVFYTFELNFSTFNRYVWCGDPSCIHIWKDIFTYTIYIAAAELNLTPELVFCVTSAIGGRVII